MQSFAVEKGPLAKKGGTRPGACLGVTGKERGSTRADETKGWLTRGGGAGILERQGGRDSQGIILEGGGTGRDLKRTWRTPTKWAGQRSWIDF